MEGEEEKPQKIQIVAFTTNEKTSSPNDIIEKYFSNNTYYLIKRNKNIIAFSTTLPEQKKQTKIMICTLTNLTIEYEGINDINCYIITIDLQKETSEEKFGQILEYAQAQCDISKKFFVLGVKKGEEDNEENKVKYNVEDIQNKINLYNLNAEYYELNLDNSLEISKIITEIFQYCFNSYETENAEKFADEGKSCLIY